MRQATAGPALVRRRSTGRVVHQRQDPRGRPRQICPAVDVAGLGSALADLGDRHATQRFLRSPGAGAGAGRLEGGPGPIRSAFAESGRDWPARSGAGVGGRSAFRAEARGRTTGRRPARRGFAGCVVVAATGVHPQRTLRPPQRPRQAGLRGLPGHRRCERCPGPTSGVHVPGPCGGSAAGTAGRLSPVSHDWHAERRDAHRAAVAAGRVRRFAGAEAIRAGVHRGAAICVRPRRGRLGRGAYHPRIALGAVGAVAAVAGQRPGVVAGQGAGGPSRGPVVAGGPAG